MNKKTVQIKGMHCRSCELMIEDELKKISGVESVDVSHKNGICRIKSSSSVKTSDISNAIENAGYCIGQYEKPTFFSRNKKDYLELGVAFFIATVIFLIARSLGIFDLAGSIQGSYSSLPIVFLVGLTAGVSTCMALVGGLVLGAASKFSRQYPDASGVDKFLPHVFFNFGRIISYFIFGGIIGMAGSFFQMSTSFLGILTVAVGLVMLLLGSQLIDIFPMLKTVSFTLPKSVHRLFKLNKKTNDEYSDTNSFVMGASTFFLPCGFTQAMQLYAMTTGDFVQGSLTMGIFAIGTAPGLLGIGGLTAAIKGGWTKLFFKTAGVVVIILALFNVSNGLNLVGIKSVFAKNSSAVLDKNVKIVNGVQEVRMDQKANSYSPNKFTIKKGIPVKWIINSETSYSCAASLVSQQLGIRASLKKGENVFNFTPDKSGTIRFSCSMGMYTGFFNVVDGDTTSVEAEKKLTEATSLQGGSDNASSCGSGGGGCGCGGAAATGSSPTEGTVTTSGNIQILNASYSISTDLTPNKFTVKTGQPVKLTVKSLDNGQGCMGSIAIPDLSSYVDGFVKGRDVVMEFTPTKKGSFPITCAMGVPRGEIVVI